MAGKIGFGILGVARIAQKALVPAILESPLSRLAAIASSRDGVAVEYRDEIASDLSPEDPARVYSSYQELLTDPEVQAVYIPAKGSEHHRLTLLASAAGKHVLCEKSLTTSVSKAVNMIQACTEKGVLLQEAFMWRHHPRSQKAKEILVSGEIGHLRIICAHFSFNLDRANWRMDPKQGGGAIWDIGCYGINAARYYSGEEPDIVLAQSHFNDARADMTTQIALTFPDDVVANIDCSFEAAYRCEVELVGSQGRIVIPRAFAPLAKAELHIYRDVHGMAPPEVITFEGINQYTEMVNHFCRSIIEGQLIPPAENGLANMQVIEQALQIA